MGPDTIQESLIEEFNRLKFNNGYSKRRINEWGLDDLSQSSFLQQNNMKNLKKKNDNNYKTKDEEMQYLFRMD